MSLLILGFAYRLTGRFVLGDKIESVFIFFDIRLKDKISIENFVLDFSEVNFYVNFALIFVFI